MPPAAATRALRMRSAGLLTAFFVILAAVAVTVPTVTTARSDTSVSPLPFDLPSTATLRASPKKVFAHYVPSFPISLDNKPASSDYYTINYLTPDGENGAHKAYGGFLRERPLPRNPISDPSWRLLDMETEVRQAISEGIDGFTMVVYTLDTTSQFWQNALLMMQAAQLVDPGFKIIPMPDMSGTPGNADAATLAKAMAILEAYPAAYRLSDGRYVVSPFLAEKHSASWWSSFLTTMNTTYKQPVAFWPCFLDAWSNAAAFAPISYGMSNWGNRNPAWNDPTTTTSTSPTGRVAYIHSLGMKWMQPVSVQDERPREGIFDEADNLTNLRDSWQIAINTDSEFVQLTTWSDYPEDSEMAPASRHGWSFLDASAYYLTRFKTGAWPTIVRDTVLLTHRTQPWAAKPTYPETLLMKLRGGSPARDTVEAMTFLTAAAVVRLTVGANTYVCAARPGVDTCTVPLGPGTVSALVLRNGTVAASVVSPYPVTSTPYVQDLSYVGASSGRDGGVTPVPQSSTVATAVSTTVSAPDLADTYGNAGAPTTNYGNSSNLSARGNVAAISYLRFGVPSVPSFTKLTSATLMLTTTTSSDSGTANAVNVQSASDTWSETALTWNNKPALLSSAVLGTLPAGAVPGTTYSIPLAVTAVQAMLGTEQTLALTATGTDVAYFWSKQYANVLVRPQLVLTFAPDATPPTAPANVTAQPSGGAVSLTWTAASDDRAVTLYNVHRSATANFTPAMSTYLGSTTAATFTDTPPVGVWYYRVVAEDAAGNRGAPSGQALWAGSTVTTTMTATPTADTYVNSAIPTANYGLDASLMSSGKPPGASYMRFVLPAAPIGKVLTSAVLQIRTTSDTSAGSAAVHSLTVASDVWTESTMTYNNRPATGTTVLGSIPAGTLKSSTYTVPLDVSALAGLLGTEVTIAATSTGSDAIWFWSRERGAAYQPQITLTFS